MLIANNKIDIKIDERIAESRGLVCDRKLVNV